MNIERGSEPLYPRARARCVSFAPSLVDGWKGKSKTVTKSASVKNRAQS